MTDAVAPRPDQHERCVTVALRRWGESDGQRPAQSLSATEIRRWSRLVRPDDRARFAVGRVLLRDLLSQQKDMDPAEVTFEAVCPRGHRSHGPLRVMGSAAVNVSISHAGPWVAAAVSRAGAVGIDVESGHQVEDLTTTLTRRVLSPAEQVDLEESPRDGRGRSFTRSWVRKEAVAKATGRGLDLGLANVDVRSPIVVVPALRLDGTTAERTFRCVDLWDRSDCVAAVALAGGGAFRIHDASA